MSFPDISPISFSPLVVNMPACRNLQSLEPSPAFSLLFSRLLRLVVPERAATRSQSLHLTHTHAHTHARCHPYRLRVGGSVISHPLASDPAQWTHSAPVLGAKHSWLLPGCGLPALSPLSSGRGDAVLVPLPFVCVQSPFLRSRSDLYCPMAVGWGPMVFMCCLHSPHAAVIMHSSQVHSLGLEEMVLITPVPP